MTLPIHRIETIVQQGGTLTLEQLPFQPGQAVEVIILPRLGGAQAGNPYPLLGTPVHYERPTESVAQEDWEVPR